MTSVRSDTQELTAKGEDEQFDPASKRLARSQSQTRVSVYAGVPLVTMVTHK